MTRYWRFGQGMPLFLGCLILLITPAGLLRAEMPGDITSWLISADRLEYQSNEGEAQFVWEADAWYGGDYNKLWLKTDGEKSLTSNVLEEAEFQALYSRAIDSFWDAQIGLRHDFKPDPSRNYAAFGFQGLAPYWFEVEATGFVSEEGDVSARLEAEYELLITQRLIFQPRFETNIAIQDVPELGIGSGINDVEIGARLRYEIVREFAPYIVISWNQKLGQTADYAREDNEDTGTTSFIAGLKLWF